MCEYTQYLSRRNSTLNTLHVVRSYYPVLKPKTLDDGAIEPVPDTSTRQYSDFYLSID